MTKKTRIKIEIAVAILLVVGLSVALYFIGAEQLVSYIGVDNTYVVMFFIALFGGMTSIGGASYTASIITFVSGGATPWLIALMAGLGTSLGDSAYFLVSRRGSSAISDGWLGKKISALSDWISKRNPTAKFIGVYLYCAFTPLPNDPLTIALGVSRARKWVILPALVLGDTTFAFLLAYLGERLPFV